MGKRRSDLPPEMIEDILQTRPYKLQKRIMGRRASDLPTEIIESILLKLPVKPLLRFKSVSKTWNTIISDPIFVRNHHQNSKSHNLFLRYDPFYDLSLVKSEHNGKLQIVNKLRLPSMGPSGHGNRLCFGEYGVLLITNNSYDRCILWNPSTRTTTKLSLPHRLNTCCSGICCDPVIDDFKVVVVYRNFYAVYSCKNKSWSNRKQHPYALALYQPRHNSSGVSINGAIYWLLEINRDESEEIIYYDPRDDKLKSLQKPEDVDVEGDLFRSVLLDLGGHLCLYCIYGIGLDTIRIWRKEKGIDENSWKEFITIRNLHMPMLSLQAVCLVGNKIVIQDEEDDTLLVYDPLGETIGVLEEKLTGEGSLIPFRETLYNPT